MLEAVGHEHLPQYFRVVGRLLKPGGRAVAEERCAGGAHIVRQSEAYLYEGVCGPLGPCIW